MKQAWRDLRAGLIKDAEANAHHHSKFSEALLQKLAAWRSTRKLPTTPPQPPRLYEYCLIVIIEGVGDWSAEEYQKFVQQEEALNKKEVVEREELQKKYKADKEMWKKKNEEKALRGGTPTKK